MAVNVGNAGGDARATRRALEEAHLKADGNVVQMAWRHLGSADRALRFAVWTAIEKVPAGQWAERAVLENDTSAKLGAIFSLAQVGEKRHQEGAVKALLDLDYAALNLQQRFDLLRVYGLVFIRLGEPSAEQQAAVVAQIDGHFPADNRAENIELSTVLAYVNTPGMVVRAVALMDSAPTQEEQIAMAKNLRHLAVGWSPGLRESYFKWFTRAANYKGGASFKNFIDEIKKDAVSHLGAGQKEGIGGDP